MEHVQLNFSAFAQRLRKYCLTEHPNLARNVTELNARSERAAQAYENAFKEGYGVDGAIEVANQTLYQGLLFSPLGVLRQVIASQSPQVQEPEQLAEKLYAAVEQLGGEYELGDGFEGSEGYDEYVYRVSELVEEATV